MKNVNIAKSISDLRKKKGITQEQLATALHISPQAVSKWETKVSQPDVQTLPLIADYFQVSIDYLFYGRDVSYDDVYEKVFQKVAAHPQMSKEAYADAFTAFGYAHHGLIKGSLKGRTIMCDEAVHISNQDGVSLFSGKGYGAILTRAFFEHMGRDTVTFGVPLLAALSDENALLVCMAILSMSDISFGELKEKLGFEDDALRKALDRLISAKVVTEKESKHKTLGFTYEINEIYHTCLCLLLATVEMQRDSLKGISCCMGYGDYPIDL